MILCNWLAERTSDIQAGRPWRREMLMFKGNRNGFLCGLSAAAIAALALSGATAAKADTMFGYTGGLQYFIAPVSGVYDITAFGAQGGAGVAAAAVGGLGAEIGGDVTLIAGERLTILVGGEGGSLKNSSLAYAAAGGGGGSFVALGNLGGYAPLVVAGGGGGGGFSGGAGLKGAVGGGPGNFGAGGAGGAGSIPGAGAFDGGGGGGFNGAGGAGLRGQASGSGLGGGGFPGAGGLGAISPEMGIPFTGLSLRDRLDLLVFL